MLGSWQRNFIDACYLQFHMFPTVWSCTTTSGLSELYIRVCLKVQEAQLNYLLWTVRLSMCLDMPVCGSNTRGAKYAMYYASILTHTLFENIKWLHSALCQNRKGPVASLAWLFPANVNSLMNRARSSQIKVRKLPSSSPQTDSDK